MAPGRSLTNRKQPADHQLIGDTRDHQEHDAKNRLSIPVLSPEKPLAEIHRLKENRPKLSFNSREQR